MASSAEMTQSAYVALALADIAVLREEIKTRTNAQQTFVNIAITALGVIAGLAVTAKQPWLFFVPAWVIGPLGLLWIDHHIVIHVAGRSVVIAKKVLLERVAFPPLLDQEGRSLLDPILETENCKLETPSAFLRAWVQILVLFVVLPLGASCLGLYALWDTQNFKLPLKLAFASNLIILIPVSLQWLKWCAGYPRIDFSALKFRVTGGKLDLPKKE